VAEESLGRSIRRNLIAGLFLLVPVVLAWILVEDVVRFLGSLRGVLPPSFDVLFRLPVVTLLIGLAVVFGIVLLLGWTARRWLAPVLSRFGPFRAVWGLQNLVVDVISRDPKGSRTVLVEFPSKEIRSLAFLTGTTRDERDGTTLAVVLLPSTWNPQTGVVRFVPMDSVLTTDWSVDEAMSILMSGGSTAPARVRTAPVEG
jgi:uncharacterized membrane protein